MILFLGIISAISLTVLIFCKEIFGGNKTKLSVAYAISGAVSIVFLFMLLVSVYYLSGPLN
jgi:hypothetical protein